MIKCYVYFCFIKYCIFKIHIILIIPHCSDVIKIISPVKILQLIRSNETRYQAEIELRVTCLTWLLRNIACHVIPSKFNRDVRAMNWFSQKIGFADLLKSSGYLNDHVSKPPSLTFCETAIQNKSSNLSFRFLHIKLISLKIIIRLLLIFQ